MTFWIYLDVRAEWRWRLVRDGNAKVMADSGEGYKNLADCQSAIDLIKMYVPVATVQFA